MHIPPYGDEFKKLNVHEATLKVVPNSPTNMTIKVTPGGFYHGTKYIEFSGGSTYFITAPTLQSKYVLVSLTIGSEIRITYGEESIAPVPPSIPTNDFPLALLYLEQGVSKIIDDIIYDVRPFFKSPFQEHKTLVGVNDANSHTISSITGLEDALAGKLDGLNIDDLLATKADMDGTTSKTFTLNKIASGTPASNVNITVNRGSQPSVGLRWNESSDRWELTNDGETWIPLLITQEYLYEYIPSDPSKWSTQPTDVKNALDILADTIFNKASNTYAPSNVLYWGSQVPSTVGDALDIAISRIFNLENYSNTLIYVDSNRTDAYDANGSQSKPFKTINLALISSNSKKCILIMPGTYIEDIELTYDVVLFSFGHNLTTVIGNMGNQSVSAIQNIKIDGNLINESELYLQHVKVTGLLQNSSNLYTNEIHSNNINITNGTTIINNLISTCLTDICPLDIIGGNVNINNFKITGNTTAHPLLNCTGGQIILNSGSFFNTLSPTSLSLNNQTLLSNPNYLFNVTISANSTVDCNDAYTVIEGVYCDTLVGDNLIFRKSAHIQHSPLDLTYWDSEDPKTVESATNFLAKKIYESHLEKNIFI